MRRSPKPCGVTPTQPSPIEGEGFDNILDHCLRALKGEGIVINRRGQPVVELKLTFPLRPSGEREGPAKREGEEGAGGARQSPPYPRLRRRRAVPGERCRPPAAEIGFTSDESARSRRGRSLSAGSSPPRRI